MWNLKYDTNYISRKEKRTHRQREQTWGYQGGRGVGRGNDWEFGISRCKLLYIRMDKQQGPTV